MENWNHTYLGLGIGHGHTDDGMTGVVTKEGKHFHTFRGGTCFRLTFYHSELKPTLN